MKVLTQVELNHVSGGVNVEVVAGAACAQQMSFSKEDIHAVVEFLAVFFTALEPVLRPTPKAV